MTPVKNSGEVTPRSHLYVFYPCQGAKMFVSLVMRGGSSKLVVILAQAR
jgi:hypothetical protein